MLGYFSLRIFDKRLYLFAILVPDTYRSCLARAKRALTNGTFPAETLALIDQDIEGTLPALHIFHPETGPLYQDLRDMLCAWIVARSDEGSGYTSGVAKIAAMFVINMPPQQAFTVMRNLLERHCMRSFYGGMATKDDVSSAESRCSTAYVVLLRLRLITGNSLSDHPCFIFKMFVRIFDTLLADGMPKSTRRVVLCRCFLAFIPSSLFQLQTTSNITCFIPARLVAAPVP
jgi:hypothetical protein